MIGRNICDSVVRATREANKKTLETASRLGMCVYQKVGSDLCRIYPDGKIVIVKSNFAPLAGAGSGAGAHLGACLSKI